MQRSSVNIWVNNVACKQITITPSTTCNDIINNVAEQYKIPKRTLQHLELHVYHNGKDNSSVPKDEKIVTHIQTMAEAGLKMEDTTSSKNKYVLLLNHDALKKAQKQIEKAQKQASGGSKSTWSPLTRFIKKRTSSSNKLVEDRTQQSKVRPPDPDPSMLEAEKMPSPSQTTQHQQAPALAPRPAEGGAPFVRARSKTITPSLSSSDLKTQEELNKMITQKLRNRASMGYERPPLVDVHFQGDHLDEHDRVSPKHSPRAGMAPPMIGSSPRSASPPPPARLFEPPPSIVHLTASSSNSSISMSSSSMPSSFTRQRSLTTSGVITNRLTPPRSQLAEMAALTNSGGYERPTRLSSSSSCSAISPSSLSLSYSLAQSHSNPSSLSHSSSSSLSSSSSSSVSAPSQAHASEEQQQYLELLAVADLLKKAS